MSNQKRSKLPIGCLIAAGILATICGIAIPISALSAIFSPPSAATLDTNAIATYAFQTALAMNLATQAASSPTLEPTSTTFPTSTDTQAPLPTATDAIIPINWRSLYPKQYAPDRHRVVQAGMPPAIAAGPTWIARPSRPMPPLNPVRTTASLSVLVMSSGWMAATMTAWLARVCLDCIICSEESCFLGYTNGK